MFDFCFSLRFLSNNIPRITVLIYPGWGTVRWGHLSLSLKWARQDRECRLRVTGCLTESPITLCWGGLTRRALGCWASSKREMMLARELTTSPVSLGWLAETCWTELWNVPQLMIIIVWCLVWLPWLSQECSVQSPVWDVHQELLPRQSTVHPPTFRKIYQIPPHNCR